MAEIVEDIQIAAFGEQAAPAPAKIKTSKRYRRLQAWQRGLGEASATLAHAVAAGVSDWNERQDRSARKAKDGALDDALANGMRAAAKTIRKAADAPEAFCDGVERVWHGKYRKFLLPW